jgi:hypothetical protein
MADPTTNVTLKDGTNLTLKGQLGPDEVAQKVSAFRASQPPPKQNLPAQPGGFWGAAQKLVPEGALGPLESFQRNVSDQLDSMTARASAFGGQVGQELVTGADIAMHPMRSLETAASAIPQPNVRGPRPGAASFEQQASRDLPTTMGVAEGLGQTAGGVVGDPRNWPLLASSAARPILQRAISLGFAGQLAPSAVNGARYLHANWDNLPPEQRAQLITKTGLSGVFATMSMTHALGPKGDLPLEKSPSFSEASTNSQVVREPGQPAIPVTKTEPLSTATETPRTGESIPPSPRSQVDELTRMAGLKDTRTPEPPSEPRSMRGDVNYHIARLADPSTGPKDIDESFKALREAGLKDDEISRRVGGIETVDPRTGIPSSREGIEDRINGPIKDAEASVDRVAGPYDANLEARKAMLTPEDKARGEAYIEGTKEGDPSISGIKDPAIEELERMFKLEGLKPDNPERGSLSFRPLKGQPPFSPFKALAGLIDRLVPDESRERMDARNILRDQNSRLALKHLQMEEKFKDAIGAHDNDTVNDLRAFMDAGEGKPGATFLKPTDQAIADNLHTQLGDRWDKIQKILGSNEAGIENYLSHLWERPGRTAEDLTHTLYAKRPLEGKAGFLRNRTYNYMSDGLDAGLKPITNNPIRMQLTTLYQLDKFIMAHDVKDMYKDAGLVEWKKISEQHAPGWQKLNDKIFQPRSLVDGGLLERGSYWANPEVAKIFNTFLDPGLRGNPTYDAIRKYGNTLNQVSLGMSAYHLSFETIVSSVNDAALGIEQIGRGNNYKQGVANLARSFIPGLSAGKYYRLGSSLLEEAVNPTGDPRLSRMVQMIQEGGGRFSQDPIYANAKTRSFFTSLKQGRLLDAVSTATQEFPLTKFIMQKYVPNIKLGMIARMAESKMAELDKANVFDPLARANELGKIVDNVDDRAGQLTYDNQFWNKIAKDTAFLGVRAVGWDFGTFRQGAGALRDVVRGTSNVLKGAKIRDQVTSRMAFTLALPMVVGAIGGVMHKLITGQNPRTPADLFFPGNKGDKFSIPSYMKDFYAFSDHPATTLVHKMHPMMSQMVDLYNNSDFYGTEIHDPAQSWPIQRLQDLKYLATSAEPIAMQSAIKQYKSGASLSSAGASFFGMLPAPSYVGESKAEQVAFELAESKWQRGPRTPGEQERRQVYDKMVHKYEDGTLTSPELNDALKSGALSGHDYDRMFNDKGLQPFERNFKSLDLDAQVKVLKWADKNERVQVQQYLKYNDILNYPPDVQKDIDRQLKQYSKGD